jgi:Cu/Zn superoxide dismutase
VTTEPLAQGVRLELHVEGLAPGPHAVHLHGTALIVHVGSDDYRSQPSGNAGGRVACAVIGQAG